MTYSLEASTPYDRSILWNLQKKAYQTFGPTAWTHHGVPFYMTSNPWTALQYAKATLGFIRDCLKGDFDSSEPLYIFDLGAGTGRFGYLFTQELIPMIEELQLPVKIKYVMTDIVPSNREFWKTMFKHLIAEGYVGIEEYDPGEKPLQMPKTKNPIVVIANYFFDTIPQALYNSTDEGVFEGYVELKVPEPVQDPLDPKHIPHLQFEYQYHSTQVKDPFLKSLCEKYKGEGPFLLPVDAFKALDQFRELSGNRMFLLAGDQVMKKGEPEVAKHGTFSVAVNYEAIQEYFKYHHGESWTTTWDDTAFMVMGGVLNQPITETSVAFKQNLLKFQPVDFWNFINEIEKSWKEPSLELLMQVIKFANFDPMSMNAYLTRIEQLAETAPPGQKTRLHEIVNEVVMRFYPVCKEDLIFLNRTLGL